MFLSTQVTSIFSHQQVLQVTICSFNVADLFLSMIFWHILHISIFYTYHSQACIIGTSYVLWVCHSSVNIYKLKYVCTYVYFIDMLDAYIPIFLNWHLVIYIDAYVYRVHLTSLFSCICNEYAQEICKSREILSTSCFINYLVIHVQLFLSMYILLLFLLIVLTWFIWILLITLLLQNIKKKGGVRAYTVK